MHDLCGYEKGSLETIFNRSAKYFRSGDKGGYASISMPIEAVIVAVSAESLFIERSRDKQGSRGVQRGLNVMQNGLRGDPHFHYRHEV